MSSANLNRYIKEYLKRQPKTLSMSQIEELVEYDAWLDEQGGLTRRALDGAYSRPLNKLIPPQKSNPLRRLLVNASPASDANRWADTPATRK